MNIPDWLQRRLARAFPAIFLVPPNDGQPFPLPVHPDHPVRIDGVTHFARGDRTDAELRAFIKELMDREADAERGAS